MYCDISEYLTSRIFDNTGCNIGLEPEIGNTVSTIVVTNVIIHCTLNLSSHFTGNTVAISFVLQYTKIFCVYTNCKLCKPFFHVVLLCSLLQTPLKFFIK